MSLRLAAEKAEEKPWRGREREGGWEGEGESPGWRSSSRVESQLVGSSVGAVIGV